MQLLKSTTEYSLKSYRILHLLLGFCNRSFGRGFTGIALANFHVLASFTFYALLSLHSILHPVAITILVFFSVISISFPSFSLVLMSSVNKVSEQVLFQHLRVQHLTKLRRCEVRTLPPLRMSVREFFYSQPFTVLTFFSIVVNNVITLRISAYPKEV